MKSGSIETEKRYLLKTLPDDLLNFPYEIIEDAMILTEEPHPHLRLRRKGDKFVLTKKYPKEAETKLQMVEETIVLNEIEFEALKKLDATSQRKWRFKYIYKGTAAELDVWTDNLEGLVIIEFEFETEKKAKQFNKPVFCLQEVTEEEWLAGGMLSGKSYKDIEKSLEKLGYKPLKLNLQD